MNIPQSDPPVLPALAVGNEMNIAIQIESLECVCVVTEITKPVVTSFGKMLKRPALFLRIKDRHGNAGYGEVWCNFPSAGATYRKDLLGEEIFSLVVGRNFHSPAECYSFLTSKLQVLKNQSGDIGAISQCIAGLDVACWDLVARRADLPIRKLFSRASDVVPAYASGINPDGALEQMESARELGFNQFKLKVGFGMGRDTTNVEVFAKSLLPDETFMIDANQAWDVANALNASQRLQQFSPLWLEEPICADRPTKEWQTLKTSTIIPLAAGENFADKEAFHEALSADWIDVVQPDVCKWGGLTGCIEIGRQAVAAGKMFCPHSLGGGIALAASAELLAIVGGRGTVEIDSNPNPFRENLFTEQPHNGLLHLGELPGLNIDEVEVARLFNT